MSRAAATQNVGLSPLRFQLGHARCAGQSAPSAPDGFGTRVLTLQSAIDSNYELTEFIILTPQHAFPLDVLPNNLVDILFLDGEKREINFPYDQAQQGAKLKSRDAPAVFRGRLHKEDPMTAIYFHPQDRRLPPVVYAPFVDHGQIVTPCYWGSHWPLARGQSTGGSINDRIHATPAHNSVMTWAMQRPPAQREARLQTIDALGRAKMMQVQTWVWLIGFTDAPDVRVLDRAKSFGSPPSIAGLSGARLDAESYSPERRAIRLVADGAADIVLKLIPRESCVNPVIEIDQAPGKLLDLMLDDTRLEAGHFAWDGNTLWLDRTFAHPVTIRLRFELE